jgi:hypothetical protein
MIGRWAEWRRFPRAERGEHIEAPIGPGIYEVREAATGALFAFGSADSVARALAGLTARPRSFASWFGFGRGVGNLDLEYRTCAASTRAEAKLAAEGMIDRAKPFCVARLELSRS